MDSLQHRGECLPRQAAHFLRSKVPAPIRDKVQAVTSTEDWVASHKVLHAEGLAVPHWPKQWGGSDWTPKVHYIYTEELQNKAPQRCPSTFHVRAGDHCFRQRGAGASCRVWPVDTVVPGLLGTGALIWPGSDRRSASDHYIVTARRPDHACAICRWILSGPHGPGCQKTARHLFLLIDMKTPGSPCGRSRRWTADARLTRCS